MLSVMNYLHHIIWHIQHIFIIMKWRLLTTYHSFNKIQMRYLLRKVNRKSKVSKNVLYYHGSNNSIYFDTI